MFRWLIRLFYRKKVRRIENMSKALAALGNQDLRTAGKLLQESRPKEYLEDLALYYFVKGRYHLERMELEQAECALHAAFSLGFRRPALFLSLGLAKARLRRLGEAHELLSLARQVSTEDEEQAIVDALLGLIRDVRSGKAKKAVESQLEAAGKRILGKSRVADWKKADWQKLLDRGVFMEDAPVEPTDESIVILGGWLLNRHRGAWEFGLEVSDCAVRIQDVAFSPLNLIRSIRSGSMDASDLEEMAMNAAVPRFYAEELWQAD